MPRGQVNYNLACDTWSPRTPLFRMLWPITCYSQKSQWLRGGRLLDEDLCLMSGGRPPLSPFSSIRFSD